ncbi:hypothetical protein BV20DRAFT_910347, partial [Pilatotrama ljubarskyi]
LSPADLFRLARTCSRARETVKAYVDIAFSLETRLSRFFPDPLAFRALQARTATLIGGYFALHFFDRTDIATRPLELYVYFHHRSEVGRWLLDLGYNFSPSGSQPGTFEEAILMDSDLREDEYSTPAIKGILALEKIVGATRVEISMIVARQTPIEAILHASSTCLVNVISFEKAYCLFPRATLRDRRALLLHAPDGSPMGYFGDVVQCMSLNFQIIEDLEAHEVLDITRSGSYPLGWRWIDDSASWVLPL